MKYILGYFILFVWGALLYNILYPSVLFINVQWTDSDFNKQMSIIVISTILVVCLLVATIELFEYIQNKYFRKH